MTFSKKKNFWIITGLALIGLWLRLIFINKPEGLWNDEYTSWAIASLPLFSKSFWAGIASQCHMPFYYLYLKFFIHFFGNSDTMLRLTSVLPGILSIIVMYFAGKEFKDEKLGVFTAAITSFSAFLIYFSQEVRIYSILFLFSALALLYMLKLGKNQNKSNFIMFIITNFLVLFTHTIGFIFVFFNLIFLSCWINKSTDKYKKSIKYLWISVGILFLLFLPLTLKIFTAKTFAQWWSHFTFAKILFMLTDFLSPVIRNIVDSPQNFFSGMTYAFILFGIIPTIIALCALIKAICTKKYEVLGLFYAGLAAVIVLSLVSMTGKLVFLTKYAIEIYPALILLVAYGFFEFKTKWLEKFLIIIYLCSNLFYNISFPNSAPKMHRSQGHKIVANLLKNADLKPGDIIILNYYPKERFEKYFNFSKYRVFSINKGTFVDYFSSENNFNKVYKEGKQLYFNNFNSSDNSYFDQYFNKNIITKLKPHQKLVIINLETVSMYSPVQMLEITSSKSLYKKTPFLFMVFSYVKNEELSVCLNKLHIQRIETKGSWAATTFEKS